MRRYRRLLYISYNDHATNVKVRRKIQAASDDFDKLMTLAKKRKLRWFVHVSIRAAETVQGGKGLLQIHMSCPEDDPRYEIEKNKIEIIFK